MGLFHLYTLTQGQREKERREGGKKTQHKTGRLFGSHLRWFYVVAQCLLTVEGGFIHTQIISGVSLPLGLWKPSLATINRSVGRMLRLAGGRHSPPQSQAQTEFWPVCAVPNTHIMCLHTYSHLRTHACIFHRSTQACNHSMQFFHCSCSKGDCNLILTSAGGISTGLTEMLRGWFYPSVAVSHFDKSRHLFYRQGNWKKCTCST